MKRIASAVFLVSLVAAYVPVARAAEPAAKTRVASRLVRTAWYWQARGRDDQAEEAWRRVLAVEPDNAEALAAVGGVLARAARQPEARDLLSRLERSNPGHPEAEVLRRAIELGPRATSLLGLARKRVREKRVDEGVALYRELFGTAAPPGHVALEYYDAVGGTSGGWEEAREGLRQLVRRAPGEVRFRLALARLHTSRDATRREGIAALAELSRDREVGKEATRIWREALLALSPTGADASLIRAYLEAHPRDAEVAAHLEGGRGTATAKEGSPALERGRETATAKEGAPALERGRETATAKEGAPALERGRETATVKEGFAALERGDLDEAQEQFEAAGNHPDARRGLALVAERRAAETRKAGLAALERGDVRAAEKLFEQGGADPDSRLGLALVAARDAADARRAGDLARARALLERSKRLAPTRPDLWDESLRSVTFWSLLEDARTARGRRREREAESLLLDAVERAPDRERWHAQLALGELYLALGQRTRAERRYREVLAAEPRQVGALRALAAILVEAERYEEALPVNDALGRAAPERAFRQEWIRAEVHRARASQRRAAQEFARARAELEEARRLDPANVWVLHDLANLLIETRAYPEARPVVQALVGVAPQLVAARVVEARLHAVEGRSADALAILRSLPPTADPSVGALRRRLEVQVRVPALLAQASSGGRDAAVKELLSLEREADAEPELAGTVAHAWSRLGEPDRAVAIMRRAVARAPATTRGVQLQLASTLLEAGDDAGVAAILAGLEVDGSLTQDQRRALADLRIAHAVRVADRSRERGDARGASSALERVLREHPADPRVLAAQARLLERREPRRAHAVFRRVLAAAPDDPDAMRGAIDTALVLGEVADAEELAREGVRRHPKDARMHLLVARAEERAGDDGDAMRSLRRAARLAAAPPEPSAAAGQSAAAVPPGETRAAALEVHPATPALRAEIDREMDRLRSRHRAGLSGAFEARSREGEPGLGQLTDVREWVEAEVPVGLRGAASFRATHVRLYAGTLVDSAADRFGTGGDEPADATADRAAGTQLSVRYEDRNVVAEAGTTPLGFPIRSWVGSLRLRERFGPVELAAEAVRGMITESVLSYAGVRDPSTGEYWGGVVTEGGRAEISLGADWGRVFGWGGADRVVGYQVAENVRVIGGGGAEARVVAGAGQRVLAGVAVVGAGFDRNLRFFTLGHGGYFSPQRLVRLGFPVRWTGGTTLRWDLAVEPGFERFEEESAPAFPLLADGGGAAYPGQEVSGYTFEGRALVAWRLADWVEARAGATFQRAPEREEVRGTFALRFGGSPRHSSGW